MPGEGGADRPAQAPTAGSACNLPDSQECSYPNGTCNGYPQSEVATCRPDGTWQLSFSSCNPPAVFDAGAPGEAGVPAEAGPPADAAAPADAGTAAD